MMARTAILHSLVPPNEGSELLLTTEEWSGVEWSGRIEAVGERGGGRWA